MYLEALHFRLQTLLGILDFQRQIGDLATQLGFRARLLFRLQNMWNGFEMIMKWSSNGLRMELEWS
jgi:hypothetical protein